MKQYFNALDKDKKGWISIDQLEELLLSVGLVTSRQEIRHLIDAIDEKKTVKVEFAQFLNIIQSDDAQNEEIVNFFKEVIATRSKASQSFKKLSQSSKGLKVNHRSSILRESTLETEGSIIGKYGKSINSFYKRNEVHKKKNK